MFARAGFNITKGSRSYTPSWDDADLGQIVRAQEMSRYVEDGFFDCGLTGRDWVQENASDVNVVADLIYSRASNRISKWVLAVPEDSPIKTVKLRVKRLPLNSLKSQEAFFKTRGDG